MSNLDELKKLHELKESGAISDAEFVKMKANIIDNGGSSLSFRLDQATQSMSEKEWAMFLHLSQLSGFIVPLLGFAAPIIIWLMKKDESEYIDRHGRIVINWIISEVLYSLVCIILMFILIGIPMLVALALLGVVYAVIGGMKAKDGKIWMYPGSIRFLKVEEPQGFEKL